jgi:ribosome-associated toxin RatA of RatAB toxin-antitoxin module
MSARIYCPRLPGWVLIAAATTFATAGPRADDLTKVEVERAADGFAITACAATDAPAELIWQVLTDFDHLSDFVPDMRVSRVVSSPGEPLRVQQHGIAQVLFFRRLIDVVFAIELDPMRTVKFRAVAGDLRRMEGQWRVLPAHQSCRIEYRAFGIPAFWVPPLFDRALMRAQVRGQFNGVIGEIRRRQHLLDASVRTHPAD